MAKIDDNIKLIDKALATFEAGADGLQSKAFDNLVGDLSVLEYAKDGRLKPSPKNLKALGKIKFDLANFLEKNSGYVGEFTDTFSELEKINEGYYSSLVDNFDTPTGLNVIKQASVNSLTTSLGVAGVNGTVTSEVQNILYDAMQGGMNRNDLISQVRTYMLGDKDTLGHLLRYSKQIADDSINQYDAGIDKAVTDSLGFEWFQYIGGVIDTTRQFCAGLTAQRYIHKSEFDKAAKGILRNQTVSKAGMIKGTTGNNLQLYRGGYQCRHKFRGVTEASVPENIKSKINKK